MHVSLDYINSDIEDNVSDLATSGIQVHDDASYLGFKGTEELGGGLSAIWRVESNVSLDANDNQPHFSTRNSFVGLSSDWGTILAGKHDTPLKLVARKIDPFNDTFADANSVVGRTGSVSLFNQRANNSVVYVTPKFSGFSAMAAYSVDQDATGDKLEFRSSNDTNKDPLYGAMLRYDDKDKGLRLMVAYESQKWDDGETEITAIRGAARYKTPSFKIGGLIEFQNLEELGDDFVDPSHSTYYGFGAYHLTEKATVKAAAGLAGPFKKADSGFTGEDYSDETGAFFGAAGFSYKPGDNTEIYLLGGYTKNGEDANYGIGQVEDNCGHFNPDPGMDVKAISLGMIHRF
jgi:predicted porin